jgi:hypothetical protein
MSASRAASAAIKSAWPAGEPHTSGASDRDQETLSRAPRAPRPSRRDEAAAPWRWRGDVVGTEPECVSLTPESVSEAGSASCLDSTPGEEASDFGTRSFNACALSRPGTTRAAARDPELKAAARRSLSRTTVPSASAMERA